jgi:hypothetical protein
LRRVIDEYWERFGKEKRKLTMEEGEMKKILVFFAIVVLCKPT